MRDPRHTKRDISAQLLERLPAAATVADPVGRELLGQRLRHWDFRPYVRFLRCTIVAGMAAPHVVQSRWPRRTRKELGSMEFPDGFNDVRDPVTGGPVVRCWGPDRYGSCPGADRHGVVACAGHRIAPINGGPESWLLEVPAGTAQCPLNYSLIAPE